MLKSLKIENYALIRSENIEFSKGFGVICGQTGAGKSIILQALALALGQRADKDVLFDKEKRCVSEAVFLLEESYRKYFDENELDYEHETVFRREILPSGKSRSFVNDTPVPLAVMKDLSERIIDINSQHNTLKLNDKAYQFSILDSFLPETDSLSSYASLFSVYRKKKNRLSQVGEELSGLQKENSYNVYVYEELEKAKLKAGEQEELEKNLEFMEAGEEIRECISSSLSLFEAEDYPAILPNLLQVKNNLAKTAKSSEKLGELAQRSESALIELRDIYAELQHIGESLNFDPESLETVKQRLDLIYSLERKHEVQSVAELLALQEKFSETLSGEEDLQNEKAELEKELHELQEKLRTLAEKIFEQRKEAAERVEQETCGLLADMGMQAAVLKIKLNKKIDLDADAACEIEFLFNANKAKENMLRPIEKVASGGELSRLMLALKALVSEKRSLPTIVFDEIDSGISGQAASMAAGIMLRISKNTQVIAISHLPQTAAKADYQFMVYKHEKDGETESGIELLDREKRILEIARLLSAGEPTAAAMTNAEELLSTQ